MWPLHVCALTSTRPRANVRFPAERRTRSPPRDDRLKPGPFQTRLSKVSFVGHRVDCRIIFIKYALNADIARKLANFIHFMSVNDIIIILLSSGFRATVGDRWRDDGGLSVVYIILFCRPADFIVVGPLRGRNRRGSRRREYQRYKHYKRDSVRS